MAIRMMASFENEEAARAAIAEGRKIKIVRDYHGHEEGVHHGHKCPHAKTPPGKDKTHTPECLVLRYDKETGKDRIYHPLTGEVLGDAREMGIDWSDACRVFEPLYMETTYEGKVLDTGEINGYHDSDFYAVVCDNGEVFRVTYGSTRGWTYPNNAVVDATPEVQEEATRIIAARRFEAMKAADEKQAKTPAKDKTVRVVKGKHKGKEGKVFWLKEQRSAYGTWSRGIRLGVALDDEKDHRGWHKNVIWVNATSVEVVGWEAYLTDVADLEREANSNIHFRGHTASGRLPVL